MENKNKKLINIYQKSKIKYIKKQNVQKFLKSIKINEKDSVRISYDIQSGSYIKFFSKLKKTKIKNIYYPLVEAINNNFTNFKTILDFGCGELTTSKYIFGNLKKNIKHYFATDISLNRIFLGKKYLEKTLKPKSFKKFKFFCNSANRLPFKDSSIDLILTTHALEPNKKNLKNLIKELFRVTKFGMILMEPHYESACLAQKKRMRKLNYIQGLEKELLKYSSDLKIIKKKYHSNNLNKSSIFILKKSNNNINKSSYIDPIDKSELRKIHNFLYSENNSRLYPNFNDIVIFSDNSQFFLPHIKIIK